MHKERRVVFAFACALVMLTGAGAGAAGGFQAAGLQQHRKIRWGAGLDHDVRGQVPVSEIKSRHWADIVFFEQKQENAI